MRGACWLLPVMLAIGCSGGAAPYGDQVTVAGSFNGYAKGPDAPKLTWNGSRYQGEVFLPGDHIELFLSLYPASVDQAAGTGQAAPVPSTVFAADTAPPTGTQVLTPIVLETPLNANYAFSYDPQMRQLHVDFAADADADASVLPPGGAQLIQALRGSDVVTAAQQQQRAQTLQAYLQSQSGGSAALGAPLVGGEPATQGFTFLSFHAPAQPAVSLLGDFNAWGQPQATAMVSVLGGNLSYKGMESSVTQLLYVFQSGGQRFPDPLNPEVQVDGGYVPPNLNNVIGGDMGSFDSVVHGASVIDASSRLHREPVQARGSLTEVYVYLPPGYDAQSGARYPVLYVHDGKDALVRGRYNDALDQAIAGKMVPPLIAVFVPAQADALARFSDYAAYPDSNFPSVTPQADDFIPYFFSQVVQVVEARYPAIDTSAGHSAMLGVDMGGVLSCYLAWTDTSGRFTRVGSLSGRFGWGAQNPLAPPWQYVSLLSTKVPKTAVQRLSLGYVAGDGAQVVLAGQALQAYFSGSAAWTGKVNLPAPLAPETTVSSPWDQWGGSNLQSTLHFLFADLLP